MMSASETESSLRRTMITHAVACGMTGLVVWLATRNFGFGLAAFLALESLVPVAILHATLSHASREDMAERKKEAQG